MQESPTRATSPSTRGIYSIVCSLCVCAHIWRRSNLCDGIICAQLLCFIPFGVRLFHSVWQQLKKSAPRLCPALIKFTESHERQRTRNGSLPSSSSLSSTFYFFFSPLQTWSKTTLPKNANAFVSMSFVTVDAIASPVDVSLTSNCFGSNVCGSSGLSLTPQLKASHRYYG